MKKPLFQGTCTALVTPFCKDGIHLECLHQLIERQIDAGVEAIVLCGTTGEAATMSDAEQRAVLEAGVACAAGRVKIIAGSGSNCTAHAIALSQAAEAAGCDGVLVVTPYYNKATPSGLVQHYSSIADSIKIPLIAYNVPSRTGVDMPLAVYEALSQHPRINGVKEASGNTAKVARTINMLADDFYVWSGNDDQTVPILSLGGQGVISVLSNLCPRQVVRMVNACFAGQYETAGRLQTAMMPLIDALFSEVNPIPIKEALRLLGLQVGPLRLPLCAMEEEARKHLQQTLAQNRDLLF